MRKKKVLKALLFVVLILCMTVCIPVMAMEQSGEKPEYTGGKVEYNETPASSVTVSVTLSMNGIPIIGKDGTSLANLNVNVPYFDLAQYGLEKFYRYPTGDKPEYLTDSEVVKRPTVLHLMLYILERYEQGLPASECGKGKLNMTDRGATITDILGNQTVRDGAVFVGDGEVPTSFVIHNFWGHDKNLMYYVNHKFPYMYPGWGATCDYILLNEGDAVDIAMFLDWDFYHRGAFVYLPQTSYTMEAGTSASIDLAFTATENSEKEYVYTSTSGKGFNWYVMDNSGNIAASGESSGSRITIDPISETGSYTLYVFEKTSGTYNAAFTPAVTRLVVKESQAVERTEGLIKAIGKIEYSETCKAKIDAAKAAYNALGKEQKKLVSRDLVADLTLAETEYQILKEEEERRQAELAEQEAKNKAAADSAIALINAIGEVSYSDVSKNQIAAARNAYDALSPEQKAYISSEVLRTLTIAEAVYATLEQNTQNAQQAAKRVEDLINAIGTVAYNTQCETAIQTARAAYNALSEEQKAMITAERVTALSNAEASYAALKKQAEEKAAAESEQAAAEAAAQAQKLEQTKAGKDSITIKWKEDKKATAGYRIYIKGGSFKKFTKVADTKKGVTSYTIKKANKKKLTAGTQYEIKIVSLKKSGKKTAELSTQKLKAVTVTAAPKISSAKRSKNKKEIALKWKKVSGASGYEIQMSTKAKTGFETIKNAKAKVTGYTKKSLSKSKVYYFRMRTYKTINGKKFYSSWSKTIKVNKK